MSADRADVIQRVRDAAWPETDDDGKTGRRLVHSRLGGLGADWDVDAVVALVERADVVAWEPTPLGFGHDLVVVEATGRTPYRFEVPAPRTPAPPTPADRVAALAQEFDRRANDHIANARTVTSHGEAEADRAAAHAYRSASNALVALAAELA